MIDIQPFCLEYEENKMEKKRPCKKYIIDLRKRIHSQIIPILDNVNGFHQQNSISNHAIIEYLDRDFFTKDE